MSKSSLLRSVVTEYGVSWAVNRSLYSLKLRLMRTVPWTGQWFETKAKTKVERLDIFSFDAQKIAFFLKNLPKEKQIDLIENADKACNGQILGFSSIELDYGYPVQWQLNPLTKKSSNSTQKWYLIPDFDKDRGDIKVIWEISRFSHFYLFARAFLLTGNRKYYKAFSSQLSDWLEKNPYSYGANYKCGQECALRLINALMVYSVFHKLEVATDKDEANIKELINCCYRKILSNFFYAYRCIKNNHTISELVGMIIGAWCCNDARQVEKAYNLLGKVILQQFSEDGGYTQFSFNYQRLALQDIECVLSLEPKTHLYLCGEAIERIKKSCLLMYQCQSSNGDLPNYGSNDGALIFPVTSCGYRDFRPVLNSLYMLTEGSRLYPAGLYDEESLWFSKNDTKSQLAELQRASCAFPEAGLFGLRDQRSMVMVVLNDYQTRPAHMDQLHIDLWIDDVNVLCDCGTYSYASEFGSFLLSTSGHNSVKVLRREQMNRHGAFMMSDWTKRKSFSFTDSSFTGVMMSRNGYQQERRIHKVDDGYQIQDSVTALDTSITSIDILFHTPCEVVKQGVTWLLMSQSKPLCSLAFDCGNVFVETTSRSLYYLQEENCNLIRVHMGAFSQRAKLNTKIKILKDKE